MRRSLLLLLGASGLVLTIGGWLLLRPIWEQTRAFKEFTDKIQEDLKANNFSPSRCGREKTDAIKPALFRRWPEIATAFSHDDNLPATPEQVIQDAVTGGVDVITDDSLWALLRSRLGTSDMLRFLATFVLGVGAYAFGNRAERSADPQRVVGNALTHAWKTFREYAQTSLRGIAIACAVLVTGVFLALFLAQVDYRGHLASKFVANYQKLGRSVRWCAVTKDSESRAAVHVAELKAKVEYWRIQATFVPLKCAESTRDALRHTQQELQSRIEKSDGSTQTALIALKEISSAVAGLHDVIRTEVAAVDAARRETLERVGAIPNAVLSDQRFAAIPRAAGESAAREAITAWLTDTRIAAWSRATRDQTATEVVRLLTSDPLASRAMDSAVWSEPRIAALARMMAEASANACMTPFDPEKVPTTGGFAQSR